MFRNSEVDYLVPGNLRRKILVVAVRTDSMFGLLALSAFFFAHLNLFSCYLLGCGITDVAQELE
jgi:hypothetical protein